MLNFFFFFNFFSKLCIMFSYFSLLFFYVFVFRSSGFTKLVGSSNFLNSFFLFFFKKRNVLLTVSLPYFFRVASPSGGVFGRTELVSSSDFFSIFFLFFSFSLLTTFLLF